MRTRKVEDLNADILEGHYSSSALCHLANISYRLGEEATFNTKTKARGSSLEAHDALSRMEEHLASNDLKLVGATYQLGRKLNFDAKTEKFINDSEADAMLTREYRKPFVVPEKV